MHSAVLRIKHREALTMHLKELLPALLACAPAVHAARAKAPPRPSLTPGPKELATPWQWSAARNPCKVCVVPSGSDDDAPQILAAVQQCNNNGTVVFSPGVTYNIGSPLDLTFLKNIDIAILGTVVFKDDPDYWQSLLFRYDFQDSSAMWRFGGEDVNIFGLGQGMLQGE